MPRLSQADYRRMKNAYRHDIALHLAKLASDGLTLTYGELAGQYGGTARGWGDVLGGIAIRCRDAGLPLLPVIVVSKETGMPSLDAVLYEDLGLRTDQEIRDEQSKCFAFDWTKSPLRAPT